MTRHDAILAKLRAFRPRMMFSWVTNGDLMQPDAGGGDWRRRIHELRDRGHVIVMKRDPKNARLTRWAWLGATKETPSIQDGAAIAHESQGHTLITVWASSTPHPNGLYEYITSDRLVMMVEKTPTEAGGTMYIAHDPYPWPPVGTQ